MAWQLTACPWRDHQRLDQLLADDWEPFAVSETADVWLRQEVARADARVVERPPRFEREVGRHLPPPP